MITSMNELIYYMENHHKERTAFRWINDNGNIEERSYIAFVKDIHKFSIGLRKYVDKIENAHIGILTDNSYHYAVAIYGIILSGGVAVPLNPNNNLGDILYEIELSDVQLILTDENFKTNKPDVISAYHGVLLPLNFYESIDSYNDIDFYQNENNIPDISLIIFTSGTTGRSKGVMLSLTGILESLNVSIENNNKQQLMYLKQKGFTEEQIAAMPVPSYFLLPKMYHVGGISVLFSFTGLGFSINITNDIRYLYRDLKAMPSDVISVPPVVFDSFYKKLKKGKAEESCIPKRMVVSMAKIEPAIINTFIENGYMIQQGYGMTESYGEGTFITYIDTQHIGSVGKPRGCKIKIENDEICLKSPSQMIGYYKNPEETKNAIDADGWLHTGDLGYLDDGGYLYITGRKKNLIILSSGENVSPEELESLLLENSIIKEVIVKEKDKKICAIVYCEDKDREKVYDYVEKVNREIAMYKHISLVEFRQEPFERTSTGKIKRGI